MAITPITVTGTLAEPNATQATGQVTFQLSSALNDGAGHTVAPVPIIIPLVNGAFSVELYANDDGTTDPQGSYYLTTFQIAGSTWTAQYSIPHAAAGATIDISELVNLAAGQVTTPTAASTVSQLADIAEEGLSYGLGSLQRVNNLTDVPAPLVARGALGIPWLVYSSSGGWPARPPVATVPAGQQVYYDPTGSAPEPTDQQANDPIVIKGADPAYDPAGSATAAQAAAISAAASGAAALYLQLAGGTLTGALAVGGQLNANNGLYVQGGNSTFTTLSTFAAGAAAPRVKLTGTDPGGGGANLHTDASGNIYLESNSLGLYLRPAPSSNANMTYVSASGLQVYSAAAAVAAGITPSGHFYVTPPAPPTVAAGAGAGTSPPTPTLINASDMDGTVSFGTGTSPAGGALVNVTFATPWSSTPRSVQLRGANANGAYIDHSIGLYVSNLSTTGFTINSETALAASQASGTYQLFYSVRG